MNNINSEIKKRVLLFKIPDCSFPTINAIKDSKNVIKNGNKDLRSTFSYVTPTISTALAQLGAFLIEYASNDYEIQLIDISVDSLLESENKSILPESIMERMDEQIKNTEYDIIGLSTMFVTSDKWTKLAAQLSKKYHPEAPIILGGGYSTILFEESLKETKADYAVIGEGEDTLLFLLNKIFGIKNKKFEKLFSQISGYIYWEGKNVCTIPKTTFIQDLDLLPFPAWDLLNGEKYFKGESEQYRFPVITTRGCPYKCTYCSVFEYNGRMMRCRSKDNVLEEIDYFYKKYSFKHLTFFDDDVNIKWKLYNSILKGLIDRNYDIKIRALYMAINAMKKETIELMAKLGMTAICMPLETGTPRMQKEIRKHINLDKAIEVFNWLKEYDFHIETNFMVGFPQETMEEIILTIEYSKKIRAHQTSFWIVAPWPGTELFDYVSDHNHLSKEFDINNLGYRGTDHFVNVQFDYDEVKTIIYDTNIELNFLRHLWFEDPKHYKDLYAYWHKIEPNLTEHAILYICLGYLRKKMKLFEERNYYYLKAQRLFKEEDVIITYGKYLDWEEKPILDYKEFLDNEYARENQ